MKWTTEPPMLLGTFTSPDGDFWVACIGSVKGHQRALYVDRVALSDRERALGRKFPMQAWVLSSRTDEACKELISMVVQGKSFIEAIMAYEAAR